MEPAQQNNKKKVIAGLVVLVTIALLAGGAKALTAKDNTAKNETAQTNSSSSAGTNTTTTSSSGSDTSTTSSYKDGTYTANGLYTSPGGNESVTVNITLKGGVVTDSSVTEGAADPEAREYQQDFISGYKAFVTGKSIDSINLSRVSGSSLTSIGFNNALTQIKDQAKS